LSAYSRMIDETKTRVCTIRGCCNVLPPSREYRWKMCERCRARTRQRAYTRKSGDATAASLISPTSDVSMVDGEDDLSAQAKDETTKRTHPDSSPDRNSITGDAVESDERPRAKKRKVKGKAVERPLIPKPQFMEAPPYQHLALLLETLQERFSSFVVAQAHYLRFKLMQSAANDSLYPMLFTFDGEYSVVADPSGGSVDPVVRGILLKIQSAVGMEFRPVGVFPGPDWAIISRFCCIHEQPFPLPLPPRATADPPNPSLQNSMGVMLKRMAGELEIVVAWDRRHRRFPGQRIVVRFRLLG